jgi:toxin ParE1/3/4
VESADRAVADAYLDRIEQKIVSVAEFPLRGTPRDDLAAGVRTLVFERRLLIAYRVENAVVIVLRVISGQRELGPLLEL